MYPDDNDPDNFDGVFGLVLTGLGKCLLAAWLIGLALAFGVAIYKTCGFF